MIPLAVVDAVVEAAAALPTPQAMVAWLKLPSGDATLVDAMEDGRRRRARC